MSTKPAAGQRWRYATPEGFESSRIVVGAVVSFAEHEPVVCCIVEHAAQRTPAGGIERVTIPFLPMTHAAFQRTVSGEDGSGDVPEAFGRHYANWREDARGLSYFTVPFPGFLDQMIAHQMQEMIKS